ncbi:MAG: hypothetical protein KF699_14150 [Phycisphaeraceae bacterium]|nr:hypothetical protein [Phycisphaeraceae bacterium]
MTRDQLENHLQALLASAAHDSPQAPRPQGTFLANSPRAGLSGMRVVTPDGQTFYLAVLDIDDFEREESGPAHGSGTGCDALRGAAAALLDARDSGMLTEDEWEDLARAVSPPPPIPEGATQRFLYDQADGLVRLVEKDGAAVLRQSAIPDALASVAEFAEERAGPFMIEGARAAEGFQFGREDAETACEFLVHLGLAVRAPDGGYVPNGAAIADKALAAMNALPES